ncbi:MAG TPA: hypothetical protein VMT75_03305 [Candidatus Saccharimonadales bacterium]|nr:hypothetical protein [Candidatus Saccharimonadales bacterium]
MLTLIILWGGVALELVLIVRAIQGGLLRRFPLFYSYLTFVLLESFLAWNLYRRAPELYASVYWYLQWVALLLGSLVIFEIYRIALKSYPGTARIARNLLLFVFALTFAKVLVNYSFGSVYWPATTTAELERNLRIVQGFAILAIAVVLLVYSIPRNRNLNGILIGYGLFVASSIVQLSLLSHAGSWFQKLVWYTGPVAYDVVLGIWTVALWSPAPEPVSPRAALDLAGGHPSLVARAEQDLQRANLGFPGAFRR